MGKEENDRIDLRNWLVDPARLLLMMSGRVPPVPRDRVDCDELATFMLGLAFLLDMPAEIVTVAEDPARPDQFSHVFVRFVHRDGTRTPYDLTSGPYPGSEPSQVFRRRIWPVDVPIDPSSFAEPDRATARTVAAMIETGRASTSHPEFHAFLKQVAGLVGPVLSGMISQEEWRRSEAGQEFLRSVQAGDNSGNAFMRHLSGEDLQSIKAWIAQCRSASQREDTDILKLIESMPNRSIAEPAQAHLSAFLRAFMDTLAAWLDELGPARIRPRPDP
jgi:hypothetical protein